MVAAYKQVRSLERGLQVLEVINECNGASATMIAKTTGLHRATVHRILETLKTGGYIAGGSSDDGYYLTIKARSLSDGYNDDSWLNEVAPAVLSDLNKRVPWPGDIATIDSDAMVVRESSARHSGFGLDRAVIGNRMPLLTTALGRAYLAFCGEEERHVLVDNLKRSADPSASWFLHLLPQIINDTRAAGYAINSGEFDPRLRAFAVPVFRADKVVACLTVRLFARAMTVEEAVARYLPAVKEAAAAMESRLLDFVDVRYHQAH